MPAVGEVGVAGDIEADVPDNEAAALRQLQ